MVRIIDLDDRGLTTAQILEFLQLPGGAVLRQHGRVIGRLDTMDHIDLEDELWAHQPEQVARGQAARARFDRDEGLPHDELKHRMKRGDAGS